jgi:thiol:disulfide interchange protein DsbD
MARVKATSLVVWAIVGGIAVALIPGILPTGASSYLNPAEMLASGRWVAGASIVFLGGLLTALTPCVYPLIPITVGLFGARKSESRGKAVLLTTAYVVGMGLVFSILGVIAAKTGQAFGSLLGDPRVAIGLAILLVLLASSMFGAFELSLPPSLMQKLNSVGGAGVLGAFLMGSVSGFIAAPCTGPVLAALLAYVANSQSAVVGGSLLFLYALGIGVPFFLIGVFALRLPKSGVWMEWVKSVLGIALIALAASYLKDAFAPLRHAVSAVASELGSRPGAWVAGLLAGLGILLGAIHRSFERRTVEVGLKAAGILFVTAGLIVRAGALDAPASGQMWSKLCLDRQQGRRVLTTVSEALWVKVCMAETERGLRWDTHFPEGARRSVSLFDQALEQARRDKRPVMVDFSAEWCAACKELDRRTYIDPTVVREMNDAHFLTVKVDGTNEIDEVNQLYDRYGVTGLPTVLFINSEGKILNEPRVTGFLGPDKFLVELKKVR